MCWLLAAVMLLLVATTPLSVLHMYLTAHSWRRRRSWRRPLQRNGRRRRRCARSWGTWRARRQHRCGGCSKWTTRHCSRRGGWAAAAAAVTPHSSSSSQSALLYTPGPLDSLPLQGERVEANARFLGTSQWCDEVASTLTLLGGLSLLHVAPGAVHLKLVTPFPTGPVRGDDPGPCATADHELSLHLADNGAGEGKGV